MTAYYNEIDPYAAQWLRNLIAAGHIAPGDVDERSIVDVRADDLKGYGQCHFFAGIGGWSYALRLAGWPDDRPVWTGSCPCQPFSAAGKGQAFADDRHLWPFWFPLIAKCRPAVVFGEQVEAAIGWGWLDAVFADLESESYACGATVLPACGVGAPHIRQRLWFVADAGCRRYEQVARSLEAANRGPRPIKDRQLECGGATGAVADTMPAGRSQWRTIARDGSVAGCGGIVAMADAESFDGRLPIQLRRPRQEDTEFARRGEVGELADALHAERRPHGLNREYERDGQDQGRPQACGDLGAREPVCELGDTARDGERQSRLAEAGDGWPRQIGRSSPRNAGTMDNALRDGRRAIGDDDRKHERIVPVSAKHAWSDLEWLQCSDGKARPTKPGLFPLAHGVQARVGKLRAAGNAIVPQVAAEFIGAFLECQP